MNHRTPPYPAGDYCLLCRSERKDSSFLESGVKTASKLALSMAPKGNSVLHLPLWVCPDCRRTVENEERRGSLDPPAVSAWPGGAERRARWLIWVCFLEELPPAPSPRPWLQRLGSPPLFLMTPAVSRKGPALLGQTAPSASLGGPQGGFWLFISLLSGCLWQCSLVKS